MQKMVEPAILYFGTPVVLISTLNADGSPNLSPMSSAWWLGWTCLLGLDASSKTTENLIRTGECVLNLPSSDLVGAVDRLALLTGSNPLPAHKAFLGYRFVADKFAAAGLTPQPSDLVGPPRVEECPVQLEAVVENVRPVAVNDPRMPVPSRAVEVRIKRVHVAEGMLAEPGSQRIDPDKWRPLIMNFRHFYGLGTCLHSSKLSEVPEEAYAPWRSTGTANRIGASGKVRT